MSVHLKETNETYFEHFQKAQKYGWRMVIAGLACIVHSIIPDFFITTGSDMVKALDQEMTERKNKAGKSR